MKRYYLEVIVGGRQGTTKYYIDAEFFDYDDGFYVFKNEQKGFYMNTIVASFPINRTIIKEIKDI